MPPNFVLLDATLPDVTRLVARQKLAAGVATAKTTTPLTAQERVFHCPRSRERGLCAYGQRTRCAPCDPRGCGADIDREAAMAAFAKSWRRERKAWTGRLAARFRTIRVYPKDLGRFQYILSLR